jgi:transmembrane sensor
MRSKVSDTTDWKLLARYLAGECSGREMARVEAWVQESPERRELLRLLAGIWESPEIDTQGRDVQDLWLATAERAEIMRKPEKPRLSFLGSLRTRRILPFAAILLAGVALPYFVWRFSKTAPSPDINLMLHTVLVANGQQESLELSDGTRVVLDAGSSFQYPSEFWGEAREVYLEGEGLFEVSMDSRRPFIIYAQDALIRVLGTRFNVRAWQNSKKVEVVVSRGRVSLGPELAAARDAVVISEGQLSTLPEGQMPTQPQTVDVEKHFIWLDREADFRDVPLQEILFQLERWYDVRFVLRDRSIALVRLTVYIDNRPIDEILELIAALTDQEVERRGNLVYLRPNTPD